MKKLISTVLIFSLLTFSINCFATMHGINYDPAHDASFIKAFGTDDTATMKAQIDLDLDYIQQQLGINIIKTFFTYYAGHDGKGMVDIVQQACAHNMQVMLGVYEFRPSDGCPDNATCVAWTQAEVQQAILDVNTYPRTVIGIVVGNEDADDADVYSRIVKDIHTIRAGISANSVLPIGTAQTEGEVEKLISNYDKNNPNDLLNNIDFLGLNLYPFWGGAKWGTNTQKAFLDTFKQLQTQLASLKTWRNTYLMETEEGWASGGNKANASLSAQQQYYAWWQERASNDNFDSFYFAAFDKLPTISSDSTFGVASIDRTPKPDLNTSTVTVNFYNYDYRGNPPNAFYGQIIDACDSNNICWPIYGAVTASEVKPGSSLMLGVDLHVIDHLLIIRDDKYTYPAVCTYPNIDLQQLKNGDGIYITWSADGKGDQVCGYYGARSKS